MAELTAVEDLRGDMMCIDYALIENITQTRVGKNEIRLGMGAKFDMTWKFRRIEREEETGASVLKTI